jgi:hypothetical protein
MIDVPDRYRRIEGSERRPARGARRVAPSDPNEKLSFTIRVRRRPDALLRQIRISGRPIGLASGSSFRGKNS